jgi:hypothetical protein
MRARIATAVVALSLLPACLGAQEFGTASGKGTIERLVPAKAPATEPTSEQIPFSPRYAWAYGEGAGAGRSTWIVLTEKQPPVMSWAAALDRAEARASWCGKQKASFVALKLDSKWGVDLYFHCPADGAVSTEMLSTWNGLDSVDLKFEIRDDKRLKGTLRTGQGSCPGADGKQAYCTPTGDFTFDAPLSK